MSLRVTLVRQRVNETGKVAPGGTMLGFFDEFLRIHACEFFEYLLHVGFERGERYDGRINQECLQRFT